MSEKKDTAKTKLKYTIKKLMENKLLENITVEEIISESKLSRPTFYKYFEDKYDLANTTYLSDITPILSEYNIDKDFFKVMYTSFLLFQKNKKFYLNLLYNTECQNSFYKYFFENYQTFMLHQINKRILNNEIYVAVDMFCYGSMNVMTDWMKNHSEQSPEQMTKAVINSMPEVLKPLFQVVETISKRTC